jgi:hypothetical protein
MALPTFKPTPFKAVPVPKPVPFTEPKVPSQPAIHYKTLIREAHVPSPPKLMKPEYPMATKMAGVTGGQRPRQEKITNLSKGQLG